MTRKNLYTSLIACIRNTKIFSRLTVSFFLILFIPLATTCFCSTKISTNHLKTQINTYSIQLVKQLSHFLNDKIFQLENDAVVLAFSDTVQSVLKNYNSFTPMQLYQIKDQLHKTIAKQFLSIHHVSDVMLCTNHFDLINVYGGTNSNYLLDMKKLRGIAHNTDNSNGKAVYSIIYDQKNQSPNYFSKEKIPALDRTGILLVKKINSLDDGVPIGYILIRFEETYFSNLFSELNFDDNMVSTFMINDHNIIISSIHNQNAMDNPFQNTKLLKKIKSHPSADSFLFEYNDANYMCTFSNISNTNMYLVSLVKDTYFTSQTSKIVRIFLIITFISFLFAFICSTLITKSISIPINNLLLSINDVKQGRYNANAPLDFKDELATVQNSFYELAIKLDQSIQEIRCKEKEKRILQFKSLQAQINPHFLSNTLNSIIWLANVQNCPNIVELTSALMNIISQSMGKGSEWTTINQEIELLKNYVTVQSFRYFEKFKVIYQIDSDILDYRIPKFLIQPIVENSIIHGTSGINYIETIIVKGFSYKKYIILSITDNGSGIDATKLNRIYEIKKSKSSFNQVGLNNIDNRIKLYFGKEYGLSISSIENNFTKVELMFPKIKE